MLVVARRIEGRKPITSGCWVSTDWRIRSVICIEAGWGLDLVVNCEEGVRSRVTAVKA